MTAAEVKKEDDAKKPKPREVKFKCPNCARNKQVEEMRLITRFFPMLMVCRDCEKEIR